MKNLQKISGVFVLFCLILFGCDSSSKKGEKDSVLTKTDDAQLTYILPSPQTDGDVSVEKTMAERRSQRRFQDKSLSADQLSQILWAAYGITEPKANPAFLRGGLRTTPSAGALYPLEIYVMVGKVKDIDPGVYNYVPKEHKITRVIDKDLRAELSEAALGQGMISEAPISIVYSAIFSRMTEKYGDRGRERYVCMDLGHSAQNVYLQTEALHLGTCAVGAFVDDKVSEVLQLSENEEPLYIMPVGYYYKN